MSGARQAPTQPQESQLEVLRPACRPPDSELLAVCQSRNIRPTDSAPDGKRLTTWQSIHILEATHRPRVHPPGTHRTPNGHDRGLLWLGPSSTSLDRDDTGYHPPHSSAHPVHSSPSVGTPAASANQGGSREHGVLARPDPTEQDPPEIQSEGPSIIPEKSTSLYPGVAHTPWEPDPLSSDSTDSLRVQLRRVNKWLDEVTKSKEEAGGSSKQGPPFALEIRDKPIPTSFGLPALESYDRSSDPIEHVVAFRAHMTLYDLSNVLMRRVFPTTLRGSARMWYNRLNPASIFSFDQLTRELEQNFLANARPKPTAASLLGITQGREEPLAQFVSRFPAETRAIPDVHPSLVIQAFVMGIRSSKLFWSLVEKPPTTVPEMMQRVNHFIAVETLIARKCKDRSAPELSRGPTPGP
ncbi:hypothetical protein BHM03_00034418 [Ensete ventricosum]|uniref:Retrotransposon gag domain-containing protein n=1 Tax=Ensete ventricosum TaxID=4639 RepID=A0A445MJ26_ENSVE|nr:hypothetical protein BHM03_00034418 [Ensete ventricosum]